MDDLTERLRATANNGPGKNWPTVEREAKEAADRIEDLQDEVESLIDMLRDTQLGPADIGMVQPEDFRGLSPYLRHGGVWGVFEVWTAEPLSGDVALWMDGPNE